MATDYRLKRIRQTQGGPISQTNVDSSTLNQWFGDTLITSRHEFVSAPMIAAASKVFLQPHWLGHVNSTVAVAAFVVSSIQAGSGFFISTTNSVAFGGAATPSVSVWWELKNPTA